MGANFLKGLLAGILYYTTLLSIINFRVLQQTSHSITALHVPLRTTNYLSNEPLRRMMYNINTDPTFLI
jgi:hypothetical protein